jgi:hypothetical protein
MSPGLSTLGVNGIFVVYKGAPVLAGLFELAVAFLLDVTGLVFMLLLSIAFGLEQERTFV